MTETNRVARFSEMSLIVLSCAGVASVVVANVIRVRISPDAAFETRVSLFVACWFAALAWAIASRQRAALQWLVIVAAAGCLIAICQAFAGGISIPVLAQVIGPAGVGVGAALAIKRLLENEKTIWIAAGAAIFGCGAAIWLALEPRYGLWKLLPNDWEVSKNLLYRWGIRMGQDRARFLFDTPMEAGVVQWFCGVICLLGVAEPNSRPTTRILFGLFAFALFGTVALTYSRAGMVLAALSIGIAILIRIPGKRRTILIAGIVGALALVVGVAIARVASADNPAVKNVASIMDPNEEANQIRIEQFAAVGTALAETPWHGRGASSFVTFADVPRMPAHESSPVNLICAFGLGGLAFVTALTWAFLRRLKKILEVVLGKRDRSMQIYPQFVAIVAPPYAIYSLVSPIFAGMIFGMICFTIIGLLAIWDTPLREPSGKP